MIVSLLSLFFLLPCLIYAAVVPFTLDGKIEGHSADTAAYNTGGKVTVGGLSITIPKNLQVQFPAAWVPWKDFVATGYNGYEISVFGNYVDGKAIAGLVQVSQLLAAGNGGIIKTLDFDGKITLESGEVVRINDPNAVYSAGYTSKPHLTADDQNPSVSAFSGFPMCVPRSADDPKCPSSQRPAGQTIFQAPDPLIMAPFKVGDYITFSGISDGGEIIAYSIVADSVQITTTGVPTYIRVEDAIIGTFDTQDPAEVAPADSRFIGYLSDSAARVVISRIDVDPCGGTPTEVQVGSASPIGVRNKWTWRASSTTLTKYAREYRVTTLSGTKATNGGQIIAGQYVAPVTEWIFPEPGVPGHQPGKLDFTTFGHLRDGLGPDANGDVWGQLDPFPDATPPSAKTCTAITTPTSSAPASSGTAGAGTGTGTTPALSGFAANAGPDISTRPGVVVTLSGKADNSSTLPANDLTYSWTQVAGPTVTLTGAGSATASFIPATTPKSTAIVKYSFTLTVKSASEATSSTDTVDVSSDPNALDIVVIDSYTTTTQKGGTISVNAHTNVVDGSATMTVQLVNNGVAGTAAQMVAGTGGKFSYNVQGVKKPTGGVIVTSIFKGKATSTTTTSKRRRSLRI